MLLLTLTSWLGCQEREILAYLIEENRVLKRQLGGRRPRLTPARARILQGGSARRTIDRSSWPCACLVDIIPVALANQTWLERSSAILGRRDRGGTVVGQYGFFNGPVAVGWSCLPAWTRLAAPEMMRELATERALNLNYLEPTERPVELLDGRRPSLATAIVGSPRCRFFQDSPLVLKCWMLSGVPAGRFVSDREGLPRGTATRRDRTRSREGSPLAAMPAHPLR
jgi:hypothetical protein